MLDPEDGAKSFQKKNPCVKKLQPLASFIGIMNEFKPLKAFPSLSLGIKKRDSVN